MKNLLKSIAAVFIFAASFTACGDKPCVENCVNGTCAGTEKEQSCICDACFSADSTTGFCTVAKDCGAHGTCNTTTEGCDCATGYEADAAGKCNTEWSAKFVGSYNVSDACTNPVNTYLYATAATRTSESAISMSNFGGFSNPMTVNMSSATDVTVSGTDAGNRVFAGSGSMNAAGTILTLNSIVTFTDGTKDTCTATYTKQ